MNKTIMWLVVGVIVAAMGVLLGSQYFGLGGSGKSGGPTELIMRPSPRPEFTRNAPPQMAPQTRMPGEPFSSPSSSTPPPTSPSAPAVPVQEPPRASAAPVDSRASASGSLMAESKSQAPLKVESEKATIEDRSPLTPLIHSTPVLTPVPVKSLVEPDTEILPEPIQPAQPIQPDKPAAVKPSSPAPSSSASKPTAPTSKPAPATPAPAAVKPTPAPPATAKPAATPAPAAVKPIPAPPAATASKPAAPSPAAPTKASGEKTVNSRALTVDGGFVLRLSGSEALRYQSILLQGPDRLVVDLPGSWDVKVPGVPKNNIATKVRVGRQADKTRIVIDLSAVPASHRVSTLNSNTLEIRIKGK